MKTDTRQDKLALRGSRRVYDNSDEGKNKTLAWRNAWDVPDLTKETQSALLEKDSC